MLPSGSNSFCITTIGFVETNNDFFFFSFRYPHGAWYIPNCHFRTYYAGLDNLITTNKFCSYLLGTNCYKLFCYSSVLQLLSDKHFQFHSLQFMSDQDRISTANVNTMPHRKVMRIKINIY